MAQTEKSNTQKQLKLSGNDPSAGTNQPQGKHIILNVWK